jgi:hypothetical protein
MDKITEGCNVFELSAAASTDGSDITFVALNSSTAIEQYRVEVL